ncbi:hypothetical protein GCM10010916_44250 [Paenibacillus abyssi]|uniref:Histidine kinase/HSP90-like ATPase domain-containing protein n=1 Tax=Paenibacillus abyssi TaxID=1340531 RepID=A0A917G4L7_9BACL|nr:hypothetical protein GCM10010916_44250 [Paenibacillus abyssi]
MIFRPGFSTASSVSDISVRGVGMDIVRNHIEKLSGMIDIEIKLGEGTRFKIKSFILPMSSVVEIVRVPVMIAVVFRIWINRLLQKCIKGKRDRQ